MTDFNFENPVEPPTLSMAPTPPQFPSYPAADASEQFGALGGAAVGTDLEEDAKLRRLAAASYTAAQYDGGFAGKQNAITDAADNRIKEIEIATGQKIGNPYRDGFLDEAKAAREAEAPGDVQKGFVSPGADYGRIKELQIAAFQSKLKDLANQYPDVADAIGADRPVLEDAQTLANFSEKQLQQAREAVHGTIAPFVYQSAGAMGAMWRDPIQAGAMVAGAPELGAIKAVRYGGAILAPMIGDGFLNAGISAISQPAVQQWRAERGQEYGVVPALQDVGMNFLFGAAIGGVRGGVHMAMTPAQADLVNRAMSGDMNAAREVAVVLPKEHAPDLHAFLEADGHDAAVTAGPPLPHVEPAELERSYQQAINHLEDPTYPLPEMPTVVDRRRTDTAAREVMDANPGAPLDALRSDPDLVESALSSDDPGLRNAGRIATLGDDDFDLARRSQENLTAAAEVAARVSDPTQQAAILREVLEARPRNATEAAQLVSEAMDRKALPESLSHILAADKGVGDTVSFEQRAVDRLAQRHPEIANRIFADEVQRRPAPDSGQAPPTKIQEGKGPGPAPTDGSGGSGLQRTGEAGRDTAASGRGPDAAPSDRAPADLIDSIPVERPDGTLALEPRGQEPRESFLADLIDSCKV
jgi:hypothetical protein